MLSGTNRIIGAFLGGEADLATSGKRMLLTKKREDYSKINHSDEA
jgi:hypothetical protein